MNYPRESGILLHPTSLPSRYGIGDIGPNAYRFAETLAGMGQHLWQILPHGLTGYGDSPYQSFSTFAGNPLLLSPELLVEDGLLSASALDGYPVFPDDTVDYGGVIPAKEAVLNSVCRSFDRKATEQQKADYAAFCEANEEWLEDFALFMALKQTHNLEPWTTWDPALIRRDPAALGDARKKYKTLIRNAKILQYLFDDQWKRFRSVCHKHGIKIVGDIPIFVAHDSADAWAHKELFYLEENGHPTVVAGVPPDYFSATGQLWGNPLYRWDYHKKTGYDWWIRRMRKIFEMVDIVRIDHFRGFEAYWEIPGDAETAINGTWVKGPGHDLFHALKAAFPELPVIAEDLGIITEEVDRLRDDFNLPGMRILQFAFGNDDKAEDYRPHNYPPNCVVYTGTHDNDTTVGWFHSEPGGTTTRTQEDIDRERWTILNYVQTDGSQIHWDLIALAMRSKANTVVFPLQDVMGLGTEARMNVPGTKSDNWRWRFTWDMLTEDMVARMRQLTESSGRIHE
ncbi:MAG TPA: 4-alpha-glucanotransferase [Kiritimatiellia bacterium]|nr:4-alpha-glucanotransferase [Kiritimatiellia bacterium]